MHYRREGLLYLKLNTPRLERVVSELFAVIVNDSPWYYKSKNYVPLHEFEHVLPCGGYQWLCFLSFGEIVIGDNKYLTFPGAGGKAP